MNREDITAYNRERWNELSEAGIIFSRPWLDLTVEEARIRVDPHGFLRDITGQPVLCLAASGGQQSVAFCLLNAKVTVFDLSDVQLQKDIETSKKLGYSIKTVQGDMQDLSSLNEDSFHTVWLAHGINFVPSAKSVIEGAIRVLKPGGYFRMECTNPYIHGLWEFWNGHGYELTEPYIDGGEVQYIDEFWDVEQPNGDTKYIRGPKQFRHSLSVLVNTLTTQNMRILGLWEANGGDSSAEGGSWNHFKSCVPPWIEIWSSKGSVL